MKHLFIAALATVALFSCKKEDSPTTNHPPGNYRVLLVGKAGDTVTTSTKTARVETVGLDSAQDTRLKAVLLAYDGHGGYTIQLTNLQSCPVTINWGWNGLNIDSISPGGNNSIMAANQSVLFKLYGSAKIGKIKLQAHGDCGNSSTLIINITTSILTITYTNYTVT